MPFFELSPRPTLTARKLLIAAAGPPASIRPLVVIGYSSLGDLATPGPYTSLKTLQADKGVGSLVEAAGFALSPFGGCGTVHSINAGGANAGTYGSITTTFADDDASTIAGDSTTKPSDSLEVRVRFKTDGVIGTTGIRYDFTTDNGFTYFSERELGEATIIELPYGAGKYVINPKAGALVALATEIRADLLAHFADASVHNSADTTAAALITAGAPATNAAAITVLNQCRTAYETSHRLNETVHDSIDYAHTITAPAATDEQSALVLGIELKVKVNLHLGETHPAAPAALKAATATVAAPVTLTQAGGDFLGAAITSLDAEPGKITFTTAGGTAADAPATVDIAGFDPSGAAQTEPGLALAQTASTVTSARKWRGTGLSITYAAADGTGATIAIGTAARNHNSADTTNTITTADPSPGVVTAGDEFYLETHGPTPDATQLVAAVRSLRGYALDFGVILFADPMTGAVLNTIKDELQGLWEYGKFRSAIVAFRTPNAGEGYTDYKAAFATSFGAYSSTEARVVSGGNRAYSPLQLTAGGYARPLRPPAWWVAAARARSDPQTCLQKLGAAPGVELKDSKGNTLPRCFDEQETQWSVEVRSVGVRTNPRKNPIGVYVTQDITLFAPDSPWFLGPYTDVANHLVETIQRSIDDTLGEGYQSPPGEPFSEEIRASLQVGVQTQAEAEGVDKGRCTEVQVKLDDDAGLNGLIKWTMTIVPLNYNVNGAELDIGLSAITISGAFQI